MKKIFIIFLIALCTINVKAYENEYFKLYIPENYKEQKIDDTTFKWVLDNNYISISVTDNTRLYYNISDYTEEDIMSQKTYIENNINKQLASYDVKVSVTNIEKKAYKDTYILNYNIYWPTKSVTGKDTYQIGNVFTTNKYIITMIYSSNEEIKDDETYNNLINSITIKDEKVKKRVSKYYYITLFSIGVLIAIFIIIRHNLKKRNR